MKKRTNNNINYHYYFDKSNYFYRRFKSLRFNIGEKFLNSMSGSGSFIMIFLTFISISGDQIFSKSTAFRFSSTWLTLVKPRIHVDTSLFAMHQARASCDNNVYIIMMMMWLHLVPALG